VLPDPLHLEGERPAPKRRPRQTDTRSQAPARSRTPSRSTPQRDRPRAEPAAPAQPASKPPARKPRREPKAPPPPPQLSHPTSAAEVQPGMYLEGRVIRVESSRVVVDICGEEATLMLNLVVPPIEDMYDREERFSEGQALRVWVRRRNRAGRLQLTMKRPNV
jgi:hypothetical protein